MVVACGPDAVVPSAPRVVVSIPAGPSVVIPFGQTSRLTAVAQGPGAASGAVRWASSDSLIALVGPSGDLLARGVGTATVTARSLDDTTRSAAMLVTVTRPAEPPFGVEPGSFTTSPGVTVALGVRAGALPQGDLRFRSEHPAIASVDEDGRVRGVGPGQATIRVFARGDTTLARTVTVTVSCVGTGLTVAQSAVRLSTNESVRLRVEARLCGNPDLGVLFRSANPQIATVTADGVITGRSQGSTQLLVLAAGDTSVRQVVGVVVSDVGPALVSIQSITDAGSGRPVSLSAVRGVIDVTLIHSQLQMLGWTVQRVELLVRREGRETVVASRPLDTTVAGEPVVLRLDTGARDAAGRVLHPDGEWQVIGRLVGTDAFGDVLERRAQPQTLTFRNAAP